MLARSRLLLDARMINIPFRKDRNLIIRETNDRRLYGVAHYVTLLSLLSRAVRVRSKRSYVCTCTLTYSEHTQTRSVVRFWTHVHTYFLSFLLFFKPSFPTTSTITTSTIATTSTISHTFCPPSASSINHPSFARDSPIIRFLSPTVDLFSISPIVPTSPPLRPYRIYSTILLLGSCEIRVLLFQRDQFLSEKNDVDTVYRRPYYVLCICVQSIR